MKYFAPQNVKVSRSDNKKPSPAGEGGTRSVTDEVASWLSLWESCRAKRDREGILTPQAYIELLSEIPLLLLLLRCPKQPSGCRLSSAAFDRCHSLRSLHLPLAALPSLPPAVLLVSKVPKNAGGDGRSKRLNSPCTPSHACPNRRTEI